MIKIITSVFIFVLLSNVIIAQTGPGGVGSSTNNLIWLDANTLTIPNGSLITTWADKSGNNVIATQSNSSVKPVFRTGQSNGFPAVDFDGVNDFIRAGAVAGFNGDQTVTYILVMRPDNTTQAANVYNNGYSLSGSNLQSRLHGGICTAGGNYFGFQRDAALGLLNANHTNAVAYRIQTDVLTGADINAYSNSALITTNTAASAVPANHAFFQLGRRPFLNDLPYNGKVAEAIAFNDALTNTQRIIVENYLSSKYGIALTANDYYALEGTGHYHNVSGIGQEGGNAVNDAEGRSRVRINNPSALANGDYLMWGHDNASLTSNSTDVPAGVTSRLNRVWRMDETVDVGTYDLIFDFAGLPSPDPVNTYILIDDDGNFSNGGTTTHGIGYSFNGLTNEATWTGVKITDGYYFTVATVPVIFSITSGYWSDPNTWNCTCVPTSSNDVLISSNDVVTIDAAETVNGIAVAPNGSLLFEGGNSLTISNYLDNQGTFNGTDGIVILAGTGLQSLSTDLNDVIFETLELNNSNGAEINSGNFVISSIGTYFPADGDFSMNGGTLVFESDASGSARIDNFNATSSITGNVTFKRFIAAGTGGYRDIAVPMASGATVSAFDDDLFISGPNSAGFADGCASAQGVCFYSFKFFNSNVYTDITTAATLIPNATQGVHAWIADGFPGFSSPRTIDLTGTVNGDGSIVASASTANTFTTIGNPYISQIDFDALTLSNIGDFYYVWDVNINNYNWYQTGNGASPLTEVIASGQGFVVMAETGFGTVTFDQSVKTASSAVFIRSANDKKDFFRLALSSPDQKYSCDVTFNTNQEASNGFDKFDVPTPYGIDTQAIYISAKVDDRIVRCFGMNDKEESLSVPIIINVPNQGVYTLNTKNLDLYDNYSCVILEDILTGSRYDLRNISDVRFNVEKVKSEETRFKLHFSNNACSQIVAGIDINDKDALVEMTNFNEYVKIDMNFASEENVNISFYNMLGQNVLSEQLQNVTSKSVNVSIPSSLKNGVYLVVVETDKKRYTRKYNF